MSEFERSFSPNNRDNERLIIESGEPIQPFLPGSLYTTEGLVTLPSNTPIVWSQIHEVLDVGLLQIGLKELIKVPKTKDTSSNVTFSITPLIPIPVLILDDPEYADEMYECSLLYGNIYGRITPQKTEDSRILIFDTYYMDGVRQKYIALDNEDEIFKTVYTLEHTIF